MAGSVWLNHRNTVLTVSMGSARGEKTGMQSSQVWSSFSIVFPDGKREKWEILRTVPPNYSWYMSVYKHTHTHTHSSPSSPPLLLVFKKQHHTQFISQSWVVKSSKWNPIYLWRPQSVPWVPVPRGILTDHKALTSCLGSTRSPAYTTQLLLKYLMGP